MITEYDSFSTHEYPRHYIIYPQSYEWWTERRLTPGGKQVPEFFRYSSDSNVQWLTTEEIVEMLDKVEIVY